jgi:hypothetical protein
MRISERKTTAAVLRFVLGEKLDPDFCTLVGCSIDLWRKLENGDRRMTERVAAHVEAATGVSRVWLLAANAKAKPIGIGGEPYTLESFRAFQTSQMTNDRRALGIAVYPAGHVASLVATAKAAAKAGQLASFAVELDAAVAALRRKYGWDKLALDEAIAEMQKHPSAYLLEATDSANDRPAAREARKELALNAASAGAFPTLARMMKRSEGKKIVTEIKLSGVRPANLLLQTEPRSKRKKAKP